MGVESIRREGVSMAWELRHSGMEIFGIFCIFPTPFLVRYLDSSHVASNRCGLS